MDCSKTRHFLMGSWSKVSEFIKKIKFAVLNMKKYNDALEGWQPCFQVPTRVIFVKRVEVLRRILLEPAC